MDFPIKNGGSFHSYVKLPKGNPSFISMPFRVPQKIHCSSHPRPLSSSPDLGRGYNIVYNPICTLYNMYMYIYISVCVYYDVIGCNYVYNIYIYIYIIHIYIIPSTWCTAPHLPTLPVLHNRLPRDGVDPKDDFLRHLPLEDEGFSVLFKENLRKTSPKMPKISQDGKWDVLKRGKWRLGW